MLQNLEQTCDIMVSCLLLFLLFCCTTLGHLLLRSTHSCTESANNSHRPCGHTMCQRCQGASEHLTSEHHDVLQGWKLCAESVSIRRRPQIRTKRSSAMSLVMAYRMMAASCLSFSSFSFLSLSLSLYISFSMYISISLSLSV